MRKSRQNVPTKEKKTSNKHKLKTQVLAYICHITGTPMHNPWKILSVSANPSYWFCVWQLYANTYVSHTFSAWRGCMVIASGRRFLYLYDLQQVFSASVLLYQEVFSHGSWGKKHCFVAIELTFFNVTISVLQVCWREPDRVGRRIVGIARRCGHHKCGWRSYWRETFISAMY